ncbi:hypothetical protein KW850_29615 [Bacillus sp. sid0103]|uniref:hypothetical protein n=1 Tax=Bacillus sp. sid0103 TaxID=2856337 RepID=UPI001C4892D0|nr:hypothetical protein [Bacillus sp. sid0103]MBV7509336.1 hypothetical protein [Bacillus sp. sid0103]
MKSTCCFESLESRHLPELYHGADDDYELRIPYLVCTKCGSINLQYIDESEETKVAMKTGGERNARNFSEIYHQNSKRTLYASGL